MKSWPTRHMVERVEIEGRCGLTADEICNLLDRNLDVPIGEGREKVIHRLFYSQPDDECFVAFQSEDGAVISVWPARWHNRRSQSTWAISDQAEELARRVAISGQCLSSNGCLYGNERKIVVNALLENLEGTKECQIRLGEHRVQLPVELQRWVEEPGIQAMLKGWIHSKVLVNQRICKLLIRQGKKRGWLAFDPPR